MRATIAACGLLGAFLLPVHPSQAEQPFVKQWTVDEMNLLTPERLYLIPRTGRRSPPSLYRSFYFWGGAWDDAGHLRISAGLTGSGGPLPDSKAHRYSASYRGLQIGSVFPVLGRLYRLDTGSVTVKPSASRLTQDEMPKEAVPRPDAYAFPQCPTTARPSAISGTLHRRCIRVRNIAPIDGVEAEYSAEVGVTINEVTGFLKETDEFAWSRLGLGACVAIGNHHHKILSIVPPDDKDRIIRDKPCRLIGWIEIEATPTDLPRTDSPSKSVNDQD